MGNGGVLPPQGLQGCLSGLCGSVNGQGDLWVREQSEFPLQPLAQCPLHEKEVSPGEGR